MRTTLCKYALKWRDGEWLRKIKRGDDGFLSFRWTKNKRKRLVVSKDFAVAIRDEHHAYATLDGDSTKKFILIVKVRT